MLDIIGELLFWLEDYKFSKRKKVRRELKKENNHPKKLLINPVWKLFGIFLVFIIIAKLIIRHFFFSNYEKKHTTKKIAEIELILEHKKTQSEYILKNLM